MKNKLSFFIILTLLIGLAAPCINYNVAAKTVSDSQFEVRQMINKNSSINFTTSNSENSINENEMQNISIKEFEREESVKQEELRERFQREESIKQEELKERFEREESRREEELKLQNNELTWEKNENKSEKDTTVEVKMSQEELQSEFENAVELKLGEKVEGQILNVGQNDYYYFIPLKTGMHSIESLSNLYMFGRLYDENGNQISQDYNNGIERNFKLKYQMEQGQKYYIQVSEYSSKIGEYGIIVNDYIEKNISGIISLQNGQIAPIGGVGVNIFSQEIDGNDYNSGSGNYIVIPEGKNSTEYTLKVEKERICIVGYQINNQNINYVTEGYYGSNGTVGDRGQATKIEVGSEDINGINITIKEAKFIKGTISLPSGQVAPVGGISIYIYPTKIVGNSYNGMSGNSIKILDGKNSAEYTLKVEEGSKYIVSYQINNQNFNYTQQGYYGTNGTVGNMEDAFRIEVGSGDVNGINLTIKATKLIKGTISLPNGQVAPVGGLSLYINLYKIVGNSYNGMGSNIIISEGKNSVEYTVKAEEGNKYIIGYQISNENLNYIQQGYYGSNGTVGNMEDAVQIVVASEDINGINVAVKEAKLIKGTISLPNGELAPTGGISLYINPIKIVGNSQSWMSSSNVTIPEGKNSADYTLKVEDNNKYIIRYRINAEGLSYLTEGYYGSNRTVGSMDAAARIEVTSEDINGINMTIKTAKLIKGIISLPIGEVAPVGGISLYVYPIKIVGNNYNGMSSSNITIQEGKNSVEYTLKVEDSNKYIVRYRINAEGLSYVTEGYYGSNGTVGSMDAAARIEVGSEDISGINMSIKAAKLIKGTISLPSGELAPVGGISVYVRPLRFNKKYRWDWLQGYSVLIKEGQNSVGYSLPVEGDNIYKINFNISADKYVGDLYYNNEKTVYNSNDASRIEVKNDDVNAINAITVPARLITGTLFLPYGKVAPMGGIEGSISVNSISNEKGFGQGQWMEFNEGDKSVNYSISIPVEFIGSEFIVQYYLNNNLSNEFKTIGYYSKGGTVVNYEDSTKILLSNIDIQDINVTLIDKNVNNNEIKLLLQDKGTLPTVEKLMYKDSNDRYMEYADYRNDGQNEIIAKVQKETNGYSMIIRGLNWDNIKEYDLWIRSGDYLLNKNLILADNGKIIEVNTDAHYTKIKVNANSISENFKVDTMAIYSTLSQFSFGQINEGMYVPQGKYGVQIYAHDNSNQYSLLKQEYEVLNNNEIIFTKDEIVKINLNIINSTDKDLYLNYIVPMYFNETWHAGNVNDNREFYLSKNQYRGLNLSIRTFDELDYQYNLYNPVVDSDRTISLDTKLKANINLVNSNFEAGKYVSLSKQVFISDSYNNKVSSNINNGSKIKLENSKESYEFAVNSNNPSFVVPYIQGQFTMTFSCDGGTFEVAPASTVVNITPTNQVASVKLAKFPIKVNGKAVNVVNSRFPFIVYKDVTYFPMSYDITYPLGIEVKWDDNTGLDINKVNTSGELNQQFLDTVNNLDAIYEAAYPNYSIRTNGKLLDNSVEQYPILKFRDITYVPLSNKFITEFGWESKWSDSEGLSINNGQSIQVVTGVELSNNSLTLEETGTHQLVTTVKPENATNKNVAWSSNNTNVAKVDTNGLVTAAGEGLAIITVKTEDKGYTATCAVTVTKSQPSIKLPKFPIRVNGKAVNVVNSKFPFIVYNDVTYFPMSYDITYPLGVEVKWDDTTGIDINKVNTNGEFNQQFLDTTNDLNGIYKAELPTFNMRVNGNLLDNSKEQYPLLKFRDITYVPLSTRFINEFGWESKWSDVEGLSINNAQSVQSVTGIELSNNSLNLEENGTHQLTATVKPENATNKNVTWSSNNTNVAIVDANGLVTAVGVGVATITVKTEDKEYVATCAVTVTKTQPSIKLPMFDIMVNGKKVNIANSKFPFIVYNDITYFPMSYDITYPLGVEVKWDNTTGLEINKVNTKGELNQQFLDVINDLNEIYKAELPMFNIRINGSLLDNAKEQYPLLKFRDITYVPLSLRFISEFGWETSWSDSTGLTINN